MPSFGLLSLSILSALPAVVLFGCQQLAPYGQVAPPDLGRDISRDASSLDAMPDGTTDARADGPADLASLEGMVDAIPSEARRCTVPILINAEAKVCAEQCVDPTGDTDCDGLADIKDPDVTHCNRLLFSEALEEDPNTGARWIVGGGARWKCGKLDMLAGSRLTLADETLLASAPSYLVEARFAIGAVANPNADGWTVALRVGLSTGVEYKCELWTSALDTTPFPAAHFNRNNVCGEGGTYGQALSPNPGAPGETYILQIWHDLAGGHCRVLNADGSTYHHISKYTGCPYPAPDTFSLGTSNILVILDYLRVFAIDG